MSETNGSAEKPALIDDKIEETRRAIKAHRALPLSRRIIKRLTSNYPSFEDRQNLAQHDMTPLEKVRRMAGSRTHTPGFFISRPPFIDDKDGKYQEMLNSSKWFYVSRYMAIRCNPVIREVIDAADDRRPAEGRVEEPWYAGLYRQVLPSKGIFARQPPDNIGIFLTDKAGVEFEAIEIDEGLIESLPEQAQQDLGEFAYGIPGRNARLSASAL